MKKLIALFAILACAVLSGYGQDALTIKDGAASFEIRNPNNYPVQDAVVVVKLPGNTYRSAIVKVGNTEVPSQIDVLEDTELVFVTDLRAGQKQKVKVIFSTSPQDPNAYRSRVHAQMFLKENGQNVPKDVISATEDNMYNNLHHHGPAIESEINAYRVYFDKKQTVDIYGKKLRRIELPVTLWYPTDQQLLDRYGDDVLYVGGSLGLGAMKGWNGTEAMHIEPMTGRESKVLAKGPVRAIMEMNVEGWEYNGKTIGMESRYTIYAGHRDVRVRNRFTGDVDGLEFATGIQKLRRGDIMVTDGEGMYANWGRDYPVGDTIKYPMQTVGLGITVPKKYVVKPATDNLNYLYVVKPDANKEIHYGITFNAEMEDLGYKTPEAFFHYVEMWRDEKPIEIVLK